MGVIDQLWGRARNQHTGAQGEVEGWVGMEDVVPHVPHQTH